MEIKLSTGKVIELTAEELRELLGFPGSRELKYPPNITWVPYVEPPLTWEITCGGTEARP